MRGKTGFTLIELVAIIAITGIVSIIFFSGFAKTVEVYVAVDEETKLSETGWIAVERIARELRGATKVTTLGTPKLVFLRPSATICSECVDHSQEIAFELNTTTKKLVRITHESGEKVVAEGVTDFIVSRTDSNGQAVYFVSLTVEAKSGRQITIQTAVRLLGAYNPTWMEVVR